MNVSQWDLAVYELNSCVVVVVVVVAAFFSSFSSSSLQETGCGTYTIIFFLDASGNSPDRSYS